MQVKINVNHNNLISSLKQAYQSEQHILFEIAQNGRRAGATLIEITSDGDNIIINDNGSGCAYDEVMNFFESGWTDTDERPFGIGLKGAIYIADEVIIRSRDWKAWINKEMVISDLEFEVMEGMAMWDGTTVELAGCRINASSITSMFAGFSVDVKINDKVVQRSHALDDSFTHVDGLGWVKDVKLDESIPQCVYYQCGAVYSSDFYSRSSGIVHLDHTLPEFLPKLVDRHSLTDESQKIMLNRFKQWSNEYTKEHLGDLHLRQEWEKMWKYDHLYRQFNMWSLFVDNPYLEVFRITEYHGPSPEESIFGGEHCLMDSNARVINLNQYLEPEDRYDNWELPTYLHYVEADTIDFNLPEGHPAKVIHWRDLDLEIQITDEVDVSHMDPWENEEVFLGKVSIAGPLGSVVIVDSFLHDEKFIISDNSGYTALEQAGYTADEGGYYNEHAAEHYSDSLYEWIQQARSQSLSEILVRIIGHRPMMAGKKFVVSFDNGQPNVEEIDG
jgi:hypothetical protein